MSDVTAESMLDAVAPRSLGVQLPYEPARGSVVLDREGWAWQRLRGSWVRTGTVITFLAPARQSGIARWVELLADHGPVELIHRANPPVNTGDPSGQVDD